MALIETSTADARTPRSSQQSHSSTASGPFGLSRGLLYATLATLVAFLILTLILAATRPPQSDEGHFANAGADIASRGRFVMPMWTPWISTLDQRVYSNMPLYFLTLGAWFKAFGVSWMSFRALSAVFGVLLVVSLLSILRSVSRDRATFVAGLVLLGLNYDLINLSSARYDVMTAALSAAGIAFYLLLRERSLERALLVANTFLAAACMTHPYALFGMVWLATFVLMLDVRALRFRHVALSAAPYIVALLAWGAYIARDPAMFRAQFAENASGRLQGRLGPLGMISAEIRERYLGRFAGWRPGAPPLMRVKVLLLVAYLAGIIGCLSMRSLRRSPRARAVVTATLLSLLLLMVADAHRWYVYLIYVLPPLALCLALVTNEISKLGRWRRWTVNAGLAAYGLFGVLSVAYRARLDVHHRAFLPAVDFVRSRLHDDELVMAGGEFGMGLDFERHVLDDPWLGYRNHRVPDYVVLSTDSRSTLDAYRAGNPAFRRYADSLMTTLRPIFESKAGNVEYQVFGRQQAPAGAPSAR
jgi:4-amino-4-deoxy-L-arabinose transferase-like glycosyltransferase